MSATDQWDWARYALGIALVLCNIGVWRGVALEESHLDGLKEAGKKLLIRSLALEALFAAVLFVVDTVGAVHQKAEIAALNAEVAPRRLSPEQQAAIAKELLPFAGKNVQVASYALDAEGAVLGFQLRDALKEATLNVDDSELMSIVVGGSIDLGVHITGNNHALVEALRDAIGKFEVVSLHDPFERGFSSFGTGPPAIPPEAIVFVGVKPITQ